jgi:aryl sulfotransferase
MGMRPPGRRYQHAIFDSGRWERFEPRSTDIVVATSMKAGTTWMQGILASLLWPAGDPPAFFGTVSPWLDNRLDPIEDTLALLEAQQHRRFIKTHTAADGLPVFDEVRYVVVGRDGRDVFMSMINHWDKMRHGVIRIMNELAGDEVADFPIWHGDVHAFFDSFISKGSFPWEGDGAPWWSHFHHCATWWDLRGEPNVLFVHYNDLLADLEAEMRRVADFCDIQIQEASWPAVVERCRLDEMREEARRAEHLAAGFVGGADSFFYKGSNGRWREVLTEDELSRYRQRVREVLAPDAATWLEYGRLEGLEP